MHPQFYLFKDLEPFSFITKVFNVGNFLGQIEQLECVKNPPSLCPNLDVYYDITFNMIIRIMACSTAILLKSSLSMFFMRTLAPKLFPRRLSYLVHFGTLYYASYPIWFLQNLTLTSSYVNYRNPLTDVLADMPIWILGTTTTSAHSSSSTPETIVCKARTYY